MAVRHVIGLACTAALVFGTGVLVGPLDAQSAAPAAGAGARLLPVTANLRGEPPTGPHAVVIEHDQQLATHTIYRPATLGASRRQRFRTITMPLLAPGLAVTFCLSFVLAFSVFPSAVMVGNPAGETHVMSIAAYETALRDNDFAMGSAIAMLMALVMLIVIGVVLVWRTTLYRGATGGKG